MTTYKFRNQGKTILCFGLVFGITLGALLLDSPPLLLGSVLCMGIIFLSSIFGFIGRKIDIVKIGGK